MKVLCIDDKPRPGEVPGIEPKEGETYTVSQEGNGECAITHKLIPCYRLVELSNPPNDWHDKDRFIPVSSIDETEFERNYNKELV